MTTPTHRDDESVSDPYAEGARPLEMLDEREAYADLEANAAAAGDSAGTADDSTVLLSWWQNPINLIVMLVSTALIAGMLGWMVGDSRSPSYNDVDTGFLKDMRIHHEQAVEMGFIFLAKDGTNPGLRTVASSIIYGQSQEIGRMATHLRSFGEEEYRRREDASMLWMGMSAQPDQMPGFASDADMDRLAESTGAQADEIFVELMVTHHEGGIEMAEYVVANGENDAVVAMAEGMAHGQRSEIAELQMLLDEG